MAKNENNLSAEQLLTPCSVGFLQFDVRTYEIEQNLAAVRKGLSTLNPRQPGLLVLPELWAPGFAHEKLAPLALETPVVLEALHELAGKYGIYLAGSLPEEVLTEVGTSLYNTLYVVGPEGIVGSYRKQQLFTLMQEDTYFSAGDDPQPIDTTIGRVAAMVCYDLRFPELAQSQVKQGAGLLVVSAQWPEVRKEHWRTLLRARAIENQVFLVGCNRCGISDEIKFGGHSVILAPDGTVLAEADDREQAVMVPIDPAAIAEFRAKFNTVGPVPSRFHDQNKVVELDELKQVVASYKAMGRKVVFTNGCFDILHVGHVSYLEAARKEGDCLIVGLNSDSSIRAIKGEGRPVNSEQSRARVLAALGCVDHVVLFDEETPHRLITTLMPDVLIKGGDWPVEKIVGATEVMDAGGKVLSLPLVDNFSTTAVIDEIRKKP